MHLVRIELHNTTNYTPLHKALALRGVSRFFTHGGVWYRLPPGTYVSTPKIARLTRQQVFDLVDAAAQAVGHRDAAIIVTDDTGFIFDRLAKPTAGELLELMAGAA